jgi:hypothetical protein
MIALASTSQPRCKSCVGANATVEEDDLSKLTRCQQMRWTKLDYRVGPEFLARSIVKSRETDKAASTKLSKRARAIWPSIADPRHVVAFFVRWSSRPL